MNQLCHMFFRFVLIDFRVYVSSANNCLCTEFENTVAPHIFIHIQRAACTERHKNNHCRSPKGKRGRR